MMDFLRVFMIGANTTYNYYLQECCYCPPEESYVWPIYYVAI
jgi:hypothetical protein